MTHAGRLFQARMWKDYIMQWDLPDHNLRRQWGEQILGYSRSYCLRRARINLYLAGRKPLKDTQRFLQMLYTVVLHIDVVDPAALDQYVKTVVIPEYCQQPEKLTTVPTREALFWVYNPGDAYFPGTVILNSSVSRIDDMPAHTHLAAHALAAVTAETNKQATTNHQQPQEFTLPSFVPW